MEEGLSHPTWMLCRLATSNHIGLEKGYSTNTCIAVSTAKSHRTHLLGPCQSLHCRLFLVGNLSSRYGRHIGPCPLIIEEAIHRFHRKNFGLVPSPNRAIFVIVDPYVLYPVSLSFIFSGHPYVFSIFLIFISQNIIFFN